MEIGLLRRSGNRLVYTPAASNTMIVLVGDNGSFANSVKLPFDPTRSKGSVYQTGVWVPLLVSGPLVKSPNRNVTAMVNVADLFQLFGEIAGLQVGQFVPKTRELDSAPMLPYLTNPSQTPIRAFNFTETGDNFRSGSRSGACVIGSTCVTLAGTQALCEDNGGTWYEGLTTCCQVKQVYPDLTLASSLEMGIRNSKYKLIQRQVPNCSTSTNDVFWEFYEIDEGPALPKLDYQNRNLLTASSLPPQGLNSLQLSNFQSLYNRLSTLIASEAPCPGDGNADKLVNQNDLRNWQLFRNRGSSWYDFNLDGLTNDVDRTFIQQNLGTRCR